MRRLLERTLILCCSFALASVANAQSSESGSVAENPMKVVAVSPNAATGTFVTYIVWFPNSNDVCCPSGQLVSGGVSCALGEFNRVAESRSLVADEGSQCWRARCIGSFPSTTFIDAIVITCLQ